MGLNSKDKADLEKAILGYLSQTGYYDTIKIFCDETGMDETADLPTTNNVLEMKWKSVI